MTVFIHPQANNYTRYILFAEQKRSTDDFLAHISNSIQTTALIDYDAERDDIYTVTWNHHTITPEGNECTLEILLLNPLFVTKHLGPSVQINITASADEYDTVKKQFRHLLSTLNLHSIGIEEDITVTDYERVREWYINRHSLELATSIDEALKKD